ncbi:hypothetical protein PHLGIDRAFT_19686 [Phlebiopsis gigantea 11061_1 CR5-6]|uniref:Uncharacterized protein n=1 Tax=Phlebiopsis gigantea (strain 11061_1 CR5-6) TaxID=745531 RepID=A0A0C3PHX9_PHLG1|nr:hypothetical protein PHLGIDRAFT_19686 [Phlebiopsis gigantea 11061_1 CR5-6]
MRASPAVGVGGMYATGQGVDAVVITVAMVPPFMGSQTWRIERIPERPDRFRVVFHDNANHIPWVWGYAGDRPSPDEPIILTTNPERQVAWVFAPADNGVPNAYTLLADIGIVGAGWWAGHNPENQVAFVPIPITDAPTPERPYWVLY